MIEVITAGILLGITLAFMIGPVFFLLIETALTKGIKKAIIFDLGVLLADVFFIAIISLGARHINMQKHGIWIFAVGGVLIILYGVYNVANAKKKKRQLQTQNHWQPATAGSLVYFAKGFFLNILNVGVFAYWLTTTITLRASLKDTENIGTLMWAYFIATVAAYFLTDLVKVFAAQRIRKKLTPHVLVQIERIVGLILILFGMGLILRGYLAPAATL